MPHQTHTWFDAHLDLAFLAETGRDMHASLKECKGRYQPAAVTLPSMREDRVRAILATVFTEPIEDLSAPDAETGAFAYPAGDVDAAYRSGMRQLKLYQAWRAAGVIEFFGCAIKPRYEQPKPQDAGFEPTKVGVLIENADPIPHPDELEDWWGVVAIGLTWGKQGRYASGNTVPSGEKTGLTDLGREMVRKIDALGIVHDLSHLNDRSTRELLELAEGRVMASHSNPRALLKPDDQRHITDETIRAVVERDGVIGLNLFTKFLTTEPRRATIAETAAHVEHVCEVAQSRAHVGLGSDFDGGLTSNDLPEGIGRHADIAKLADELSGRGWSDEEINGFTHANWARFWSVKL